MNSSYVQCPVLLRTQSTEQYYSVLQSTTPVLPCTTKYHYYYKVRLQNYKVLLGTTKHCYCTTLFYKVLLQGVLLQDYSVLQSISPPCYKVLLCSTKYVSSTTTYYSVLQRTTPVLIHSCSVLLLQYYSVLQSTTAVLQSTIPVLATPVLLCTTMYYSSTTKYYYVLKSLTWHVTDIARSNTGVIVQPHQILCLPLPRKMSLMTEYRHISKVIYNAPSNRCHPPTSPNIAPVSKSDSHAASSAHMRRYLFTMCGATSVTLQPHQILRVPRKMTRMLDPRDIWNVNYKARSNRRHPSMSPNIVPATENAHPKFATNLLKTGETSFTMRGRQSATRRATEVSFRARHVHLFMKNTTFRAPALFPNFTKYCACHEKWQWNFTKYCACHEKRLELEQVLRLPRKLALQLHQVLRLPQKVLLELHQLLRLPVKQTFIIDPNARSTRSHPNVTKYCACHGKWLPKIWHKFAENRWNVICNVWPIRDRSENDPSMKPLPCNRGYFSRSPRAFVSEKYNISRSGCFPNFTRYCACHEKWHFNFTQYCACHKKWQLLLLDSTVTWLYYYLTIPFTWLYYYLTIPITWLYYYLTIPITWRFLSLDSAVISLYYYLTIPITWRVLSLDSALISLYY